MGDPLTINQWPFDFNDAPCCRLFGARVAWLCRSQGSVVNRAMASIDWKNAPLEQSVSSEGETSGMHACKTHWTIQLSEAQIQTLVSELNQLFETDDPSSADPAAAAELRIELPKDWMLFCKQRPTNEGSRFLVAHPEIEKWVGTLALEPALGRELAHRLSRLAPDEHLDSVLLEAKGPGWKVAPISNLSISFVRSDQ